MSTNLFNYTNQKLNAEQFRVINGFNSFNYAGVLGEKSPFVKNGNTYRLVATEYEPVTFIGGGLVLTQTSDLEIYMTSAKQIACLYIELDPSKTDITTDAYDVSIKKYSLSYFKASQPYTVYTVVEEASGDPSLQNFYVYDNGTYTPVTASTIVPEFTYYIKYEASTFSFQCSDLGDTVFHYNGNTLWLNDNTFIIPLIARWENDEFYEIVRCKSLKDLSTFLSLDTYNALKAYCEGTFVWSVGGQDEVTAPDGTVHKKGDIGGLNITGATIRNNKNIGSPEQPVYTEPVNIPNIKITELAGDKLEDQNRPAHLVYISEDGTVTKWNNYRIPIAHGGTDATTKLEAKTNLGIRYGTDNPGKVVTNPAEGDIYLKIIE